MSTLSQELDRYLSIRRSLGLNSPPKNESCGSSSALLKRKMPSTSVRRSSCNAGGVWQSEQADMAHRLGVVRLFAQWLHSMDAKHEVPPQSLIPNRVRRPHSYIYSEDDIRRIVEVAAELPSINGIRALTCSTLFGLIAVTGLRVSEALSLDAADLDLENGVITLQQGKLGKARYCRFRIAPGRVLPITQKNGTGFSVRLPRQAFFVADRGQRLTDCGARYNFAAVCQTIGLRAPQTFHRHGRGPRIHDLRHTFAVRTLLNWYRNSKEPAREMIKLSTYLGHPNPAHTYWYIEAVPELLELASKRVEEV